MYARHLTQDIHRVAGERIDRRAPGGEASRGMQTHFRPLFGRVPNFGVEWTPFLTLCAYTKRAQLAVLFLSIVWRGRRLANMETG